MYGWHLRANDGVIFTHFFCKCYPFQRCICFFDLYIFFFSFFNCCNQRTNTNSCCPQIIDFIYFQSSINFACCCQYGFDFICCHSVQTTTKRIQLHIFYIFLSFDKSCRFVQSGMICPLITHNSWTFHVAQMCHTIFCQNCNVVTCNQFWNTMVNFGVNMIRATSQNNPCHIVFFQICNGFLPFFMHILSKITPFFPASFHSHFNFFCSATQRHKFLCHTFDDGIHFIQCQKWVHKANIFFFQIFYIIFDIFIIWCNNRTIIVVICCIAVTSFIHNTRIEYKIYTFVNQIHNMSMYQFCRIANRLTGNRIHTMFKQRFWRIRRQFHTVA